MESVIVEYDFSVGSVLNVTPETIAMLPPNSIIYLPSMALLTFALPKLGMPPAAVIEQMEDHKYVAVIQVTPCATTPTGDTVLRTTGRPSTKMADSIEDAAELMLKELVVNYQLKIRELDLHSHCPAQNELKVLREKYQSLEIALTLMNAKYESKSATLQQLRLDYNYLIQQLRTLLANLS